MLNWRKKEILSKEKNKEGRRKIKMLNERRAGNPIERKKEKHNMDERINENYIEWKRREKQVLNE